MSHNQSRVEKTEGNLRRSGRSGSFGKNRGFSSGGKGGGPSATAPALPSSPSLPPSSASHEFSTNRSVKKSVNGQGEQTRVNPVNSNSDAGNRAVLNGAYAVTPSHGIGPSNGLESGSAKPVDSFSNKKIPRAAPKTPAAQSSAATPGDESGPFLQFGTINPGIMNGMQVPARTCSAPPNLDEQKRDQARHGSVRVAPALPIPSAPKPQQALQQPPLQQPLLQLKQQQTVKDTGGFNHAGSRESHPPTHLKRDMHVPIPSIPSASPARSSVLNVGGMQMHAPFQQPQIPVQFSGPNMQIPSQGMVPSSLQMTMTLPGGNLPQVPQQLFVPNIQSHPLQPPAIIHQGQNLGFTPQLGHQLPPQLGSMGVSITPQFHQQQHGSFVSQRKAVKITHPETHEELKLDKRTNLQTDSGTSGQRQLPNATSQSQSLPTFNQQIGYYPTTYNHSSMFFPSSLPLSSTQMTTGPQAARYGYPVGQNGQTISFMNPSALNSAMGSRPGFPPPLHGLPEAVNSEASSVSASLAAPAQVTIKPALLSASEKVGTPSVRISMPITKPESPKQPKLSGDVPVAPQLKDKEVVSQNTTTMHKKSYEAPVTDSYSSTTDKNLTRVSSMVSGHINNSEASSLASTVGNSASVVADKDGRKKEDLKSESLKDEQRRSSKRELKHSQQQIDALEDTGSLIMHSAKTSMGNNLTDAVGHLVSNDSARIHSASAVDSFTSVTSLHSTIRESKTSELDQKRDTVGALGPSRATLEEEPPEAVSSNCSDPVEVAGDRLSSEAAGHLEASTSSTDVDVIMLETSGVSLDSSKTFAEVGQIQETLTESECGKGEVSGGDLLGSSSAKPLSITGSSDETDRIQILEVESKTDSQLCDGDDLRFSCLEEDGGYSVPRTATVSNVPTTTFSDSKDTELAPSDQVPFSNADDGNISATDSKIYKCETHSENVAAIEHGVLLLEIVPMTSGSEIKLKPEVKTVELSTWAQRPSVLSGLPDKPSLEPNTTKTKKKKMKEILSKADAAGSSDLYNAYKGPDQKLDAVSTSETIESSLVANSKNNTVEDHTDADVAVELGEQSKAEIEDWEDVADASTPKLTSDNGELAHVEKKMHADCGNESTGKKKYSRDFLLTFSEQCKDLPKGFEVGSDITDMLMCVQTGMARSIDRDMSSPGRVIDRSPGVSRGDRRMAGISDDDRWMKGPNALRIDLIHGVAMNVRPGQGVNKGVLINPRVQSPNQLSGGILSGPMQSLTSQGGIARNNSDVDRWQRATGTQRGLMPPPQGSMQVMHKSANRYEVGKVSDEEEQKQRQLKAILNKLTPQNFEKLFAKVKEVNIDNTVTLTGVISQIFDKALMEPTFCEMYSDFCFHLASDLPDFVEDNEKVTFRRLLLNKCQEEFERGEREEAEADKAVEEGEIYHSEAEREEKRIQARRRMLGNIRLIGELYKKKMLTEGIMHGCIKKLLGQYQNPDEENIEALCKLMSTIGEMIDHSKVREHMDAYFEIMANLSTNQKLSSRVRFMLKDTIDLRKNKWRQRRKVEGPKKIDDVHRDAAQERQAQTTRLARGPIISSKRMPSIDYGHRGSTILNSPSSQLTGNIRGLPGQFRGPGSQDVRLDNRNQFESRVLSSVPLPQRPTDVGSITLGPQGGLAKGMSGRGQGLVSNVPLAEITPRTGDSHRLALGPNGFSSTHERIPSTSREESMPKYLTDRSSMVTNDQTSFQDRNSIFGIRDSRRVDRALDRSGIIATTGRRPGSSGGKISSEPKALSEDTLRDKSISTIREFYSAKDEKEVVLCIRDLSAPSFYPTMVSLWVLDSFDKKNMERSLLAQLLVNLSKGHDSLISRSQLIKGFESVLSILEDAVTDAPRAAEFLGHFLGKVVVENLVPLREIGKLIREGGEEPGSLVDAGLGSEILGSILEFVKMEKGDSFLNEIRTSSNLRLEDFRPPYISAKTKKLDAFL